MRYLLLLLIAASAFAQRGTTDVRGTVGYTTFIDESPEHHLFTGASVRHYLLNRLSVEPEFVFLYKNSSHKDVGFQVNVAYDFAKPGSKVVPYVIGGGGLLASFFRFGGPATFTTTEGMVSGGFGVKVYLNDRWFIAPEARLGFEPIIRGTVSVGYSWR